MWIYSCITNRNISLPIFVNISTGGVDSSFILDKDWWHIQQLKSVCHDMSKLGHISGQWKSSVNERKDVAKSSCQSFGNSSPDIQTTSIACKR